MLVLLENEMERLTKREGKHCIRIGNEWRRHDVGWDKLAEYEDLEEQGLLLKLPCKAGSTIYKIYKRPTTCTAHGHYKDEYICRGCKELECDSSYKWYICKCIADVKELVCISDKIGKAVFFTKEEAEQKLKEIEGE